MQVVDVHLVPDSPESEFVGLADCLAALYAATGHPHGEPGWIVVTPVALLRHCSAAELATPDNESFLKQPALLQVLQQPGNRLVGGFTETRVILLDTFVRVPLAAGTRVELDKTDSALDQAAGKEAVPAKH